LYLRSYDLSIVHIIISISTSDNTIHRFTIYVAGTGLRTAFTNYRRRDCQRIYLPDRYIRARLVRRNKTSRPSSSCCTALRAKYFSRLMTIRRTAEHRATAFPIHFYRRRTHQGQFWQSPGYRPRSARKSY